MASQYATESLYGLHKDMEAREAFIESRFCRIYTYHTRRFIRVKLLLGIAYENHSIRPQVVCRVIPVRLVIKVAQKNALGQSLYGNFFFKYCVSYVDFNNLYGIGGVFFV